MQRQREMPYNICRGHQSSFTKRNERDTEQLFSYTENTPKQRQPVVYAQTIKL